VAAWAARPHRAGLNRPGPVRRSRLCRHTRLPLSCEGREEGRPGCGVGRWVGGRWGGELVRRAGELVRRTGARHPVSCPSWWPAAVIWRRRAAVVPYAPSSSAARRRGCGSCGTIRVQQAGSPSCGWWSSGLLATGRALPCRVEGSGGLPGGRCRGGGHGRGPTRSVRRPCVSPKCRPCAISCHPAAPCGAGVAARALRAGGQVCLGSLPRAQFPSHTAVRRSARRAAAASRRASPRP
jgi:hypothetical protein